MLATFGRAIGNNWPWPPKSPENGRDHDQKGRRPRSDATKLCADYKNSMSSKIRSQELLRYVHTSQLATANHCGMHQSHITTFAETIHQHQALQTDANKLSSQMCVDFLNDAMRGTTHLEGVLDTCYTARKASGHTNP